MRDYLDLGPTPSNEECQQVGTATYDHDAARQECQRYIAAIRAKLGPEPPNALLKVKSNPHDFGSYLSVVCQFEDTDETATAYAYRCDDDAPTEWEDPDYAAEMVKSAEQLLSQQITDLMLPAEGTRRPNWSKTVADLMDARAVLQLARAEIEKEAGAAILNHHTSGRGAYSY